LKILCIDLACSKAPAVALCVDEITIAAPMANAQPHSQAVLAAIRALLKQADMSFAQLDAIAVGVGPGSFTGVRLACATAAAILLAHSLALIELSSLAITAAECDERPAWVIEDARAGFAYIGCWQGIEAVHEDRCVPLAAIDWPARFAAHEAPPGAKGEQLAFARPRAQALAALAAKAWRAGAAIQRMPRPRYLQPSQAERNAA